MAYEPKNFSGPRVSEFKLKEQMCDIGKRIWQKGYCAGNEGNHSVRIGPNRFLCTPTGISKGFLKPDDICVVDADGNQISGKRKRTSEFLLHATIYKARPDVNCVVHSHPPHATAFAVAGVELPTCIHPEAEVFLGVVPTAKYVTPGDKRLGESIAPFLKDSNTVLLGNHGVVCFDVDLENTYYKLEIVDAYARILLLAKDVGSINPLSGKEMEELIALKGKFGLNDKRAGQKADQFPQSSDFISRVGNTVATRGMVQTGNACAPCPPGGPVQGNASAIDQVIGAAMQGKTAGNVNEQEFEQMVQVITDQIMASA